MIIGITGGIGSGKSTIARALAARGYAVYDCDREAKRIIAENKDVQQQIIALLGPEAFSINPSLSEAEQSVIYNTSYVAQRVFAEPELLERLNQIVHPAVKADIIRHSPLSGSAASPLINPPFLFLESAILYESGLDSLCDKIFVVDAPEEIRIARTIARDYHGDASPENINKVRARIRAQHDQSTIKRPCRVTINQSTILLNDGRKSIDELAEEIIALLN